jgi:hypothetical protein
MLYRCVPKGPDTPPHDVMSERAVDHNSLWWWINMPRKDTGTPSRNRTLPPEHVGRRCRDSEVIELERAGFRARKDGVALSYEPSLLRNADLLAKLTLLPQRV